LRKEGITAAASDRALRDRFWPILLKKSAVFFKAEKHASKIEILNVRRAFQAEISRRSVLKRRFHRSILRHSEKADLFNRIGRFRPVTTNRFGLFFAIAAVFFEQVIRKRISTLR
jgi:hypothetical protein